METSQVVASLSFMDMESLIRKMKPLMMAAFIIVANCIFAQSYDTSSKKAVKLFQKSKQEFLNGNYDEAMSNVNKALQIDDNFTDAYLLKAELHSELKEDTLALLSYEKVFEIDSSAFPKSAISLSRLYAEFFCFDKSVELLEWYLDLKGQSEHLREMAEKRLDVTKFRKALFDNPVEYNPRNIGNIVNASSDEYVNQFYVNEGKMIFTRRYESDSDKNTFLEENVFVTTMYDSVWLIPELLFDNLEDIGAANISATANEIYFSGCGWENGLGSCDIYYVEFENGKCSEPINIKSVNTSEWESQPCLSQDGMELYFVRSNKKNATSDILVSKRDADGNWQKPTRLDSAINTKGNEMAPFIHHDGKTLYFSSDGHPGMGGYDLFMSQKNEKGEWTKPVNLGYPLNTKGDEMNIVVSNDAAKAYMSAIRKDGYGNYDIYEFDLDERFRPQSVEIEMLPDVEYYAETLEKQNAVVLKNIYFEFDSDELKPDSEAGITAVYDFLTLNPDKNVSIEGHTDDIGDEEYNLRLSERRAESIKKALVEKGVSPDRIKTKGCGSSQPLFPNNFDDELKRLNRRVSMSLID